MNITKSMLQVCFLLMVVPFVNGQISSVKLQLKFNETTSLYECYMIAEKGHAKTMQERVQFNSQIGLVVPAGAKVAMAGSLMPLQNNKDLKGSKPAPWIIASEMFTPSASPGMDFVGIAPALNPTAFYNEINEGEAVKLFSFNVTPIPACKSSVRLFDNIADPSAEKLGGGDFSNGFTLGGIDQKYTGNLPSKYEDEPISISFSTQIMANTDKALKLNAGKWDNVQSYSWTGPNGFKSTQKNPTIKNANLLNGGTYTLTVTNKNGCTANASTVVVFNETPKTFSSDLEGQDTELRNKNNATIFPNPASDSFSVSINTEKGTEINVDLLDGTGKLIRKSIASGYSNGATFEARVAVGNLEPGVYLVSIKTNDEIKNHKLIVVK